MYLYMSVWNKHSLFRFLSKVSSMQPGPAATVSLLFGLLSGGLLGIWIPGRRGPAAVDCCNATRLELVAVAPGFGTGVSGGLLVLLVGFAIGVAATLKGGSLVAHLAPAGAPSAPPAPVVVVAPASAPVARPPSTRAATLPGHRRAVATH